ncbi:MAG TPA: sugar phosphate isomerase/epimerase family protein [Acidimicrobiales bacterium]|nr:sugar phosphate isomerase/epimerase family protein [Acidimicrobiales bacterium]
MNRPRLAAFPKGFFYQLIERTEITVEDFIRRAPSMQVEGVELYPDFLPGTDDGTIGRLRAVAGDAGVELPMMCSSPDFVDPAPGAWERAVGRMRELVDVMAELTPLPSWRSVRVLSGQAWPGVPEEEGLARAVEGIRAVLEYAAPKQVWVVMENHYKDGLWTYPEFAQSSSRFVAVVDQVSSPWFGVNFDPSNAIVAGEDPLELLDRVLPRVRSVGASDRSLRPGHSLAELEAFRGRGYPDALKHGVVGQGLNDYEAILSRLSGAGFSGWISIEDGEAGGEQGFADIASSACYLQVLIDKFWPK